MTELPAWLTQDAVSLFAEPWDNTTVRFVWEFSDEGAAGVGQYVSNGYPIRLSVTRSTSGTPITPLDGTRIFYSGVEQDITSGVPILSRNTYYTDFDGPPVAEDQLVTFPVDIAFDVRSDVTKIRPYADTASLYDRNLSPDHTYYYTLFLLIPTGDTEGELVDGEYRSWVAVASTQCKLPGEFHHGSKLYDLLPPYYRYIDQAYLPVTGRAEGDLQRLLKVVGQELDYTRALAEGIGGIYDIDRTDERLLQALGEQNFGATYEPTLGPIRYRSIMSGLPHIYNTRGSAKGTGRLAQAASQYQTRTTNGTNLLRVTNDAEFVDGTGMWTTDHSTIEELMDSYSPVNLRTHVFGGDFSGTTRHTLPSTLTAGFPNGRRTYSVVSNTSGGRSGIFYGLGNKLTTENDRFRREHTVLLDAAEHALPVNPAETYTFSAYIRRVGNPSVVDPGPGQISIGIMLVADDHTVLQVAATRYSTYSVTNGDPYDIYPVINIVKSWADQRHLSGSTSSPDRYSVSVSPFSTAFLQNVPHGSTIYAVPFIVFEDTTDEHHVSCCMFNKSPKLVGQELPSILGASVGAY